MNGWSWAKAVGAVVSRPGLWPVALRQLRRMAPTGWWRRWPFLPVPTRKYRELRLITQYGGSGHAPEPRDVLHYLVWCRQWEAGVR